MTRNALLAAVTALLVAVAPRAQQISQRPNVLLVTLDTFRADRVGAYGYKLAATPHLDRLAREGVRFADATSQAPLTAPAHAALLTGLYPTRLGVKDNASTPLPESAQTLAETLKDAGYRTGAFIGAFILDREYGFAQGFDTFDSAFKGYRVENKQSVQRPAGEVIAPAIAWIRSATGAPFFAWVHLYDAHTPYAAPPPFGRRFAQRPYDGEVAYADMAVGRLLEAVSSTGALERTIVIVVGDHGEALGDHGEQEHGIFLYEPVLHVPFIVRLPRGERAGTIVREQVRSIDLMPTVLDLAGVPRREGLDGESLARVMRGSPRADPPPSYADSHYPELHFGWSALRSWRVGEWKYVDAPKPELYDMRSDRAEAHNVAGERANVASRMSSELSALHRGFSLTETPPPQPDSETLARLRSLGYVGLATPSRGGSRGPDPKDRIVEFVAFEKLMAGAQADVAAGRPDAAIQKLKRAVVISERAYDAHVLLGSAWMQKRDYERALGEFEAAALLNPQIAAPHVLAAEAYLEQRRFEDALKRLEAAARIEPASGEIAYMRGRVHERAGRPDQALAEFQRAVAINPSDIPARARLVSVAMGLRRFDLAEPQLGILLEHKYQPARTHYVLGVIAETRGDLAKAAAEYKRTLALEPGHKEAAEALARVGKR